MNDSAVVTKVEGKHIDDSAVSLKGSRSNCTHCGIAITDRDKAVFSNNADAFCCWGCETVYTILKKGNFSLINKPSAIQPEYDFLVNAGMYLLNPSICNLIPKNEYFDMTDLISKAQKMGFSVGVYPVSEKSYIDVGQLAEYKKNLKLLLNN